MTAELRRHVERQVRAGEAVCFEDARAILSLLDELDRLEKLVGPEWRGLLDDLRAAEQRVAALEALVEDMIDRMDEDTAAIAREWFAALQASARRTPQRGATDGHR